MRRLSRPGTRPAPGGQLSVAANNWPKPLSCRRPGASRGARISPEAGGGGGQGRRHNVVMRDRGSHPRIDSSQRLWREKRVQIARGHWRRDEAGGAIRSAGWWEAVTVTWSPAATPGHRPPLWHRTLAAALDTIAPSIAELVAASARQLLERQRGARVTAHSSRRQLPTAARALPRPGQLP